MMGWKLFSLPQKETCATLSTISRRPIRLRRARGGWSIRERSFKFATNHILQLFGRLLTCAKREICIRRGRFAYGNRTIAKIVELGIRSERCNRDNLQGHEGARFGCRRAKSWIFLGRSDSRTCVFQMGSIRCCNCWGWSYV
jgi:hypothetical protein